MSQDSVRYISFNLGEEQFATPLLSVREVIGVPDTTPIPQAAAHFIGIMNLRGQVVSIMDLRKKLGIKPLANEAERAVMICDLGGLSLGIIVDSVNQVLTLDSDSISPKPSLGTSMEHEYIWGVYRKESTLILFLDIAKSLSLEESIMLKNGQTSRAA
jgi:purine-binding chemotaxis protein CheW